MEYERQLVNMPEQLSLSGAEDFLLYDLNR